MTTENLLTLVDVQASIGFKITGDFIEKELGVTPAASEKRAKFYTPEQYHEIRRKFVEFVTKRTPIVKGERAGGAPAPSPVPSPTYADDDEI